MKYALKTAILIGAIAIASPAAAEPVKQVVELFTSQSCSSCPPADRLFGEVVKRDGIIGLAWHVDYWNYLDWKDTFSSSEATKRQYAYAKAFGTKQVYTPQFVLNGRKSMDADSLASATGAGSAEPLPVEMSATASKDRLVIRTGGGKGDANLIMVQFDDEETVNVANGENSGRTLTNHYAVTGMHTVGMWSGKAMQIDLPLDEYMPKKGMGCAVLLQRMDGDMPGEIIGAATISWK
jgi:hypothetical protein